MKILTPEEEKAHDRVTWQGGIFGGLGGLAIGVLGVYGASARFPAFRHLSIPFRAFITTSTASFGGIITADHYSRAFERSRHADADFKNQSERTAASLSAQQPLTIRAKTWLSEQRYPIVFGSWVASMGVALAIVGRSPHMSAQQKLVQARVYAQGLTLAVLVASFALESNDMRAGKGRWETVKVLDPDDPEHKRIIEKRVHHESYEGQDQWMDMIEAQERKMREKGEKVRSRKEESEKPKSSPIEEHKNEKKEKEASSSGSKETHSTQN